MRRLQIYIYTSFSNDVGISIATFGPHNKKVIWLYDVVKKSQHPPSAIWGGWGSIYGADIKLSWGTIHI